MLLIVIVLVVDSVNTIAVFVSTGSIFVVLVVDNGNNIVFGGDFAIVNTDIIAVVFVVVFVIDNVRT